MARPRTELQSILEETLGSRNVYFQPPESLKLKYPCIVYSLASMPNKFADNEGYIRYNQYQVTVIDEDPDSEIREKVALLPMIRFDRSAYMDRLNHYYFTISF